MNIFILLFLLGLSHGMIADNITTRSFPTNFLFGAGTSSYQIEGAWNVDGRGESIWDTFVHQTPSPINNGDTADIAADSYRNYRRDVEILGELGLDVYRFSLSWSRILPTGFPNKVNQAAIEYYNDLINELLKYNIQPFITLYHWELPQSLQDLGGWANPYVVQWFEDYARVVFEHFGDRVKYWTIVNEPLSFCSAAYNSYPGFIRAPDINSTGIGDYMCIKHALLAQATVYHLYKESYDNGAKIGISMNIDWYAPFTNTEADIVGAETAKDFEWKVFANPIFTQSGGFPDKLIENIAKKSKKQGFFRTRFPQLTDEERLFIRGSADFLGLNTYTTYYVSATENLNNEEPSYQNDKGVGVFQPTEGIVSPVTFVYVPGNLRKLLKELKKLYPETPLYITENGWGSNNTTLEDNERIVYHRAILSEVLGAIEDGVQVRGYIMWSLFDCFEWTSGYADGFGLYKVDYNDPARTRTPKKSAFVFRELSRTKTLDYDFIKLSTTARW